MSRTKNTGFYLYKWFIKKNPPVIIERKSCDLNSIVKIYDPYVKIAHIFTGGPLTCLSITIAIHRHAPERSICKIV